MTIKVMSFNIRTSLADKGTANAWTCRKERAVRLIQDTNPDIIGFQEVYIDQFEDLCTGLPGYVYGGSWSEGKGYDREYAVIFYKESRFTRLDGGIFWLSETPDRPGMGWDAHYERTCSYARLLDKEVNREFMFFNTHLDHAGQVAILEGAKLVRQRIDACDLPVIITGDFNCTEASEAYKAMIQPRMKDAKYIANVTMKYGTFHAWKPPCSELREQSPIDFVFLTQSDFEVLGYEVLVNGEPEAYSSDHYPIVADVRWLA